MASVAVTGVLLACLGFSAAVLVSEQASPSLQCEAAGISKVRVAVTSVKNASGIWTSAVSVHQNGRSEEIDYSNPSATNWNVAIEQTANRCNQYNSVLETVIYLTAPAPTVDNYQPPISPWNWNCPTCPECRACPVAPICPTVGLPETRNLDTIGYEFHEGLGYYKYHNKPLTWPEARDKCKTEGAHLLVINHDKENEIVKSYLGLHPISLGATSYYYIWIGASKINNEFTTVLGGKLSDTGYSRWAPGKPNNPLYAFCLSVYRADTAFHDTVCNWKLAFICEHHHKERTEQSLTS